MDINSIQFQQWQDIGKRWESQGEGYEVDITGGFHNELKEAFFRRRFKGEKSSSVFTIAAERDIGGHYLYFTYRRLNPPPVILLLHDFTPKLPQNLKAMLGRCGKISPSQKKVLEETFQIFRKCVHYVPEIEDIAGIYAYDESILQEMTPQQFETLNVGDEILFTNPVNGVQTEWKISNRNKNNIGQTYYSATEINVPKRPGVFMTGTTFTKDSAARMSLKVPEIEDISQIYAYDEARWKSATFTPTPEQEKARQERVQALKDRISNVPMPAGWRRMNDLEMKELKRGDKVNILVDRGEVVEKTFSCFRLSKHGTPFVYCKPKSLTRRKLVGSLPDRLVVPYVPEIEDIADIYAYDEAITTSKDTEIDFSDEEINKACTLWTDKGSGYDATFTSNKNGWAAATFFHSWEDPQKLEKRWQIYFNLWGPNTDAPPNSGQIAIFHTNFKVFSFDVRGLLPPTLLKKLRGWKIPPSVKKEAEQTYQDFLALFAMTEIEDIAQIYNYDESITERLSNAQLAYHDALQWGPSPQRAKECAKRAEWAYKYAKDILKHRFPEGEKVIAKDSKWACWYAQEVVRGEWPEGEPSIIKDPNTAYLYADHVLHKPWKVAEPVIAQNAGAASKYAIEVLKGRFPEAEPTLEKDWSAHILGARSWVGEYLVQIMHFSEDEVQDKLTGPVWAERGFKAFHPPDIEDIEQIYNYDESILKENIKPVQGGWDLSKLTYEEMEEFKKRWTKKGQKYTCEVTEDITREGYLNARKDCDFRGWGHKSDGKRFKITGCHVYFTWREMDFSVGVQYGGVATFPDHIIPDVAGLQIADWAKDYEKPIREAYGEFLQALIAAPPEIEDIHQDYAYDESVVQETMQWEQLPFWEVNHLEKGDNIGVKLDDGRIVPCVFIGHMDHGWKAVRQGGLITQLVSGKKLYRERVPEPEDIAQIYAYDESVLNETMTPAEFQALKPGDVVSFASWDENHKRQNKEYLVLRMDKIKAKSNGKLFIRHHLICKTERGTEITFWAGNAPVLTKVTPPEVEDIADIYNYDEAVLKEDEEGLIHQAREDMARWHRALAWLKQKKGIKMEMVNVGVGVKITFRGVKGFLKYYYATDITHFGEPQEAFHMVFNLDMPRLDASGQAFKRSPFHITAVPRIKFGFRYEDLVQYIERNQHPDTFQAFQDYQPKKLKLLPEVVNGVADILFPPTEIEDIASIYAYDESLQDNRALTYDEWCRLKPGQTIHYREESARKDVSSYEILKPYKQNPAKYHRYAVAFEVKSSATGNTTSTEYWEGVWFLDTPPEVEDIASIYAYDESLEDGTPMTYEEWQRMEPGDIVYYQADTFPGKEPIIGKWRIVRRRPEEPYSMDTDVNIRFDAVAAEGEEKGTHPLQFEPVRWFAEIKPPKIEDIDAIYNYDESILKEGKITPMTFEQWQKLQPGNKIAADYRGEVSVYTVVEPETYSVTRYDNVYRIRNEKGVEFPMHWKDARWGFPPPPEVEDIDTIYAYDEAVVEAAPDEVSREIWKAEFMRLMMKVPHLKHTMKPNGDMLWEWFALEHTNYFFYFAADHQRWPYLKVFINPHLNGGTSGWLATREFKSYRQVDSMPKDLLTWLKSDYKKVEGEDSPLAKSMEKLAFEGIPHDMDDAYTQARQCLVQAEEKEEEPIVAHFGG